MNKIPELHRNNFPAKLPEILDKIDRIDPVKYGKTRNYIDGAVTMLSPYISRGVISTRFIFEKIQLRGFELRKIEKLIQELAWRDYWQQVWIAKGDLINNDLKTKQNPVDNYEFPINLYKGKTGITAIDRAILNFYETGYLHNHIRMYIASIACNIRHCHWKLPAQWMYYHLLDADWASNALSWQWVAGSNSKKKYFANQQNINKYCYTNQKNTFLDIEYDAFETMQIPERLRDTFFPDLKTKLPSSKDIYTDSDLPTLIYNFYNIDPYWKSELNANRILLLEPSHFNKYPVSEKSIEFCINLSENIENIQLYVGEFDQMVDRYEITNICFKEHPLNRHYTGNEDNRDWMFKVSGYFPSFFAFWKKARKELEWQ